MKARIVVFLLLVWLVPLDGAAQQEFRIGMPCVIKDCRFEPLTRVLTEAYGRLGKRVTFLTLPSLRELDLADSGVIDGCLARTSSVASQYKDLIQVPFPILRNTIVACFVGRDVAVPDMEALRDYKVGILRGSALARGICDRLGIIPVYYNKVSSGLKMLQEGRIDVAVEEHLLARMEAERMEMELGFSQPLHLGYYYHWLNRRHAWVTGDLAETLRSMAVDGTTERLLGIYSELMVGPEVLK